MLENIEHLDASVFQRLLRKTVLTAIVAGVIAVGFALWLAPPLVSVGIVLGLGVAVLNLRFLDAGVAKIESSGEGSSKVIKRILLTKTTGRLAVITAVAIILLVFVQSLGLGMVIGLVVFQVLFVANAAKVIFAQGSTL